MKIRLEGKKIAIWGTGHVSENLLQWCPQLEPYLFIDNNINKRNSLFHGTRVMYPDDIIDWKNLYVIVATYYYEELFEKLGKLGLSKDYDYVDFLEFLDPLVKPDDMQDAVNASLDELIQEKDKLGSKTLLFSAMAEFDSKERGVCNFVNNWDKAWGSDKVAVISEATEIPLEYTKSKIKCPVFKLPSLFSFSHYYKRDIELKVEPAIIERVKQISYLNFAAQLTRKRAIDMLKDYEYLKCYYTDLFIRRMIEILQPERIIMWSEYNPLHYITAEVCRELGIKTAYMEWGMLPGTFAFDECGEMGESEPALKADEFLKLPVTQKELEQADEIIKYLYNSRKNRRKQEQNNALKNIIRELKPQRPTIFFAGQETVGAGMNPYTEQSQKFHSPVFKSNEEAVEYLAQICEKNDWNFIYKPHPLALVYSGDKYSLPANVHMVTLADVLEIIDFADVTLTIVSSVAYLSLIRNKATLMLGYIPLKDKECTYQAFRKEDIEEELGNAVRIGMTQEMNAAFRRHVAQMVKYYLYDDLVDREIRYGRPIEHLGFKDVE